MNIEDQALGGVTRWGRIALVAALGLWTIQFARTPISADAVGSFLHLPDVVFHEAGHIIFAPFAVPSRRAAMGLEPWKS